MEKARGHSFRLTWYRPAGRYCTEYRHHTHVIFTPFAAPSPQVITPSRNPQEREGALENIQKAE